MKPPAIRIRPEVETDHPAIYDLTRRAFAPMRFAAGNEQDLISILRDLGALSLSLVAEHQGEVVGHVALSPVTHESGEAGWFGLGPISVEPALQRQGVGGALIAEAKRWLSDREARGCILTGDPNYLCSFWASSVDSSSDAGRAGLPHGAYALRPDRGRPSQAGASLRTNRWRPLRCLSSRSRGHPSTAQSVRTFPRSRRSRPGATPPCRRRTNSPSLSTGKNFIDG